MSRNKTTKGKDGKRKETRAEKHARIESQRQAREACEKMLPYVVGGVMLCLILFALYVRSVPPRVKQVKTPPPKPQGVPEFMNIDVDPKLSGDEIDQAALEEAMRLLQEAGVETGDEKVEPAAETTTNGAEKVEL